MKRITSTLLAGLLCIGVSATTLYDQLCNFNFNWKKYFMQAPNGEAKNFSSDRELIQAHLAGVLNILRNASTADLSDAQKINRAQMIDLLDGYRVAGNFPINYYCPKRTPVFIDENGTHCAVGYLMMMSGNEEMAQRISMHDNYVWVKDLDDPGVPEWQKNSGLSFEELALIQGAYDFYPENAWVNPDKYNTPQMPICTTAYFQNDLYALSERDEENVWCSGEGKNGLLNGNWVQNYAVGLPWIKGFYINGKRSGQWEEYFRGTHQLCRTEHWSNDKLNGVRTRYDENGNVIELITFCSGNAICKINYDLTDSLEYVRIPLDSTHVYTRVMDNNGNTIACGKESIYNPSNLKWYQNIQLTALNTMMYNAQDQANGIGGLNTVGGYNGDGAYRGRFTLFNERPLVQYKKYGDWTYYVNPAYDSSGKKFVYVCKRRIPCRYSNFGSEISTTMAYFLDVQADFKYDSMHVTYKDNQVQEFLGYHDGNQVLHLQLEYFSKLAVNEYYQKDYDAFQLKYSMSPFYDRLSQIYFNPHFDVNEDLTGLSYIVRSAGKLDENGNRIGEWDFYEATGDIDRRKIYKVPTYVEHDTSDKL